MMTVDAAFDRIGSALRQRGYTFVREEKPRDASGDRSAVFKSPAMSVQVGWKGKARLMTLEVDRGEAGYRQQRRARRFQEQSGKDGPSEERAVGRPAQALIAPTEFAGEAALPDSSLRKSSSSRRARPARGFCVVS